jgi:hypothetical protein
MRLTETNTGVTNCINIRNNDDDDDNDDNNNNNKSKGKAVPLKAWSDPEGSRKLGFPDFVSTA